jgi:hypothetical protein
MRPDILICENVYVAKVRNFTSISALYFRISEKLAYARVLVDVTYNAIEMPRMALRRFIGRRTFPAFVTLPIQVPKNGPLRSIET